jgi:hypothetical protein
VYYSILLELGVSSVYDFNILRVVARENKLEPFATGINGLEEMLKKAIMYPNPELVHLLI